MPLAHVDVAFPRAELRNPLSRRRIRVELWEALARMGYVDNGTIRYVRDPLDGPLAEQGLPDDHTAIIRISAEVRPRTD